VKLLTLEEAADALGVHKNTLRALLPKIGYVDLNRGKGERRLIRIRESDLTAYVARCAVQPKLTFAERRRA
jgi:excisionase family DNA binding protein